MLTQPPFLLSAAAPHVGRNIDMKVILLSGIYVPALTSPRERAVSSAHSFRLRLLAMFAVALAAIFPIVLWGIPNGADLPNHLRFAGPFYESLRAGHFHPAWLAESNFGLGDLRFTVYPPGLYYLLSAGRLLTGAWYSATILTFALLSITGCLGAWLWARNILSARLAIWVGIFYAVAPYRLNELYQASLLSEYAACSVLPFAFAFVERICRKKSPYDIFGLAASYALIILMHLPVAVIGSVTLAVYALARVWFDADLLEKRETSAIRSGRIEVAVQAFKPIARLGLGAMLGLAASSFFWTSMAAELPWIKAHAKDPNPYYDYRLNFLFSSDALTNRNTWYANVLGLVVIGFILPGLVLLNRSLERRRSRPAIKTVLALCGLTFLMTTPFSRPLWALVPKLSEIQFPWRWLSVVSLMSALLVAASIPGWKAQFAKFRPRDIAVGLAFALSLVFVATQIVWDCEYINYSKFESLAHEVRGAISFKDFQPVWARDFKDIEKMNVQVDAGSRAVTIDSWEPEHRSFHLAAGAETNLHVRTYFYPHWVASIAGHALPARPTSDGLIQIDVPQSAAQINLDFQPPARVRIFEILSLFSWIVILAALVKFTFSSRRNPGPGQQSAIHC